MQQLDDFFKEQNEKYTVDNSKQTLHWQQLQLQLNQPIKKRTKYKFLGIAALIAILLCVGFYFAKNTNTINYNNTTAKKESSSVENNTSTDLPKTINDTTTLINSTKIPTNKIVKTEPITNEKAVKKIAPQIINKEAQFYIDLSKEPEIFSINPTITNSLTCKQGSIITIPANSIVGKNEYAIKENVTVIVQEYYRYEEQNNNQKVLPTAGMLKYEIFQEEQKLKIASGKTVDIKMKNGLQHFKIVASDDALTPQEITEYNWISNEKFYTDSRSKIDYKITLNENFDAKTFMSQIAFPKYNALLPGNIENNSLLFTNVPVGETIYFISLGKVGKKYFSCSKKLVSGTTNIKAMDFLEISESIYHQQLEMYSKLGKGE
jgi:cytoskeletal protein RodZ